MGLVNEVMIIRVPYSAGNFLTNREPVSLSRRAFMELISYGLRTETCLYVRRHVFPSEAFGTPHVLVSATVTFLLVSIRIGSPDRVCFSMYTYTGVPGGMCQTLEECSLR